MSCYLFPFCCKYLSSLFILLFFPHYTLLDKFLSINEQLLLFNCNVVEVTVTKNLQNPYIGMSYKEICLVCYYELWSLHTCRSRYTPF